MSKLTPVQTNIVQPNDDGIRQADSPDRCFYCRQLVGQPHLPACVALCKKARITYEITIEEEVPHSWTKDDILFHRNESSWCANNLLARLEDIKKNGCLCGVVAATGVEDDPNADPYVLVRDTGPQRPD